jgi:predicted RNase H-like HicB family nuclease
LLIFPNRAWFIYFLLLKIESVSNNIQNHWLKFMKFPVTLYQDEEGWYIVECPIIPGCLSQGETQEEALQNIKEAIDLCLEVRKEKGLPLTVRTSRK